MGIARVVGGVAAAGLGAVGLGVSGLAGEDGTGRDDAGAIVEEGELGAFRIRLGDCLDGLGLTEIESVTGVPCSEPHEAEVYWAFNINAGPDYPGEAAVFDAADEACFNRFEPFVGRDYASSKLELTYLYPTKESWEQINDREVLCMIVSLDGSRITGSAEGSGW